MGIWLCGRLPGMKRVCRSLQLVLDLGDIRPMVVLALLGWLLHDNETLQSCRFERDTATLHNLYTRSDHSSVVKQLVRCRDTAVAQLELKRC